MAYCIARQMRFYYVEAGEGLPVLLLHPAPLDLSVWLYQILPLSEHFRVVAMDQRCFGRSEKPERSFDLSEFGNDLEAFLDALSIPSAHIIGMSIGGIAAQLLALSNPSRIRRLVLVGTTATTSAAAFVRQRLDRFQSEEFAACYSSVVATLFSPAFRDTDLGRYLVGTFAQKAKSLSRASILRFYEALQRFDISDAVRRITHPTLVIAGTEDVTYDLSQQVAGRIPGARFFPLRGYGRAVSLEAPQQFTQAVLEFLVEARG